jgi:rod shape-determining protein MreC
VGFWAQYRNTAALVLAVVLQFVLLGYQVRRGDDMTLLRAWTMGAVSPVNKGLHGTFDLVADGWREYIWLVGARDENSRLRRELQQAQLENQIMRRDLAQSKREESLIDYREQITSTTLLAQVIGGGASAHSKEIILDKGRRDGVKPGMAIVVAEGVVGKVLAAYPGTSLGLLIDDSDSGAGVILGGSRVRGVLRGLGRRECLVDYVEHEVEVAVGEEILTSGDDRIFPRGLPVGRVTRIEPGADFQEIYVAPHALLDRLDEVLIVTAGVHEELPPHRPELPETLLPLPPGEAGELNESLTEGGPPGSRSTPSRRPSLATDADRVKQAYRDIAASQGVRMGHTESVTAAPDFNANPDEPDPDSLEQEPVQEPEDALTRVTPSEPEPAVAEPQP